MLGVSSFVLAERNSLPTQWIFAGWVGLVFAALMVRIFTRTPERRSLLRLPFFVPFLIAWLVIHTAGTIIVIRAFNILATVPFTILELWGLVGTVTSLYEFSPRRFRPPHARKQV